MSTYVELHFDSIEHSTPNAILFDFGEEGGQWIPISMLDMEEFDPEESNIILVKEWYALKEGLI